MKKAILGIRIIGDPCLRAVSTALESVGASERVLIQAMIETMHEANGVGLAAPQVGINKQIIIIDVGEGAVAMINPEILERRGTCVMEEGCLSVPEEHVEIERAEEITVRFLDQDGVKREMTCSGLFARAVQHECDHLCGKLIVDYQGNQEKHTGHDYPDVKL